MQPRPASISRLIPHRAFSSNSALYIHAYRTLQNAKLSPGTSASDKLFADAAREEAEGTSAKQKSARLQALEQKHENWTGDESMQDAVLRMLVDKYKPLRSGTIVTAEQKLKKAPPKVHGVVGLASLDAQSADGTAMDAASSVSSFVKPASGSWATQPLLPSSPTHRPWHTEYKVPSHVVSSIKLANIPHSSSSPQPPPPPMVLSASPKDEQARKKEKEFLKRTEQAGRLGRAKESTLDYRLGIKKAPSGSAQAPAGGRPNPVSMRGWNSLIEDKIEKARIAGLFNHVKGRGQPLVQTTEEKNPFIGREEFLMNRIIQKNGAAPPWVEFQSELDTAVNTFRDVLRQSYTRRVIRNLAASNPPALLAGLTLYDIKAHRDTNWEQRERTYHETAVAEINALVRKYNGQAPYAVRRAYYMREVEVGRLRDVCAEDILADLKDRVNGVTAVGNMRKVPGGGTMDTALEEQGANEGFGLGFASFRDLILGWMDRFLARWRVR